MTAAKTARKPSSFSISTLCREGAKAKRAAWTLYARKNTLPASRIKVSLPRLRPKSSILRNRYRRRMREALRRLLVPKQRGWDFFLIARERPGAPFDRLQSEIRGLLRQVGYLP